MNANARGIFYEVESGPSWKKMPVPLADGIAERKFIFLYLHYFRIILLIKYDNGVDKLNIYQRVMEEEVNILKTSGVLLWKWQYVSVRTLGKPNGAKNIC